MTQIADVGVGVVGVPPPKIKRKSGSTLFPTNPKRVLSIADLFGKEKAAEGLGISLSYMNDICAGRQKYVSRTMDLAAECILRRHGKEKGEVKISAVLIVKVLADYWLGAKALVESLEGQVFEQGADVLGQTGVVCMNAVFILSPEEKAKAVTAFIEHTGGTVNKVVV